MSRTTYIMDPERLIRFAKLPSDIPQRFMASIYDQLWAYWLRHCSNANADTEHRAAVDAIKSRQNGWCSLADIEAAGFTDDGRPMVPDAVVREVVTRTINSEPPC